MCYVELLVLLIWYGISVSWLEMVLVVCPCKSWLHGVPEHGTNDSQGLITQCCADQQIIIIAMLADS